MISLKGISVSFGKKNARVEALKDVSLDIGRGEFVTITGKSGCGKTTLLNVIGGILPPDSGSYEFDGIDVYGMSDKRLSEFRNKKIGFVVQHFALINEKDVTENIMLPLRYRKEKDDLAVRDEFEILNMLEISDKKRAYPTELSGGQKQRVAIARALITNPDVILADEPTGALDEETGKKIMDIFKKINDGGKTIIMVTHDMQLALLGTRQITMKDGIITDIKNI